MSAVYAACKAGMISFTKTMAVELAEHGIRVNGIAPDHTITPGSRGNRTGPVDPANWTPTTPEAQLRWARLIPLDSGTGRGVRRRRRVAVIGDVGVRRRNRNCGGRRHLGGRGVDPPRHELDAHSLTARDFGQIGPCYR